MIKSNSLQCDLLVIGGGIAGITAAVEASETGRSVVLVEREHYLGGKVVQMHRYFPKICPPQCGLEINLRRLRNNPLVVVLTGAVPGKVSADGEGYITEISLEPRFVSEACTSCGDCGKVCSVEVPNPFDLNLTKAKAIRLPHELAYPYRYFVEKSTVSLPEMSAVANSCPVGAIDLAMQPSTVSVNAKSIIYAAGWQPYNAFNLPELGFGQLPNVVTNVLFERIASLAALNSAKITRPSDGSAVASIAFVQCAGSRDENHLSYCSAVCCMASLKQSRYVREAYPDAEIHVFFIDARTPGRWEDFYMNVQDDAKVILHRGKVGKIEAAQNGDVTITAENTVTGELEKLNVGMAVLAVGMQPSSGAREIGLPLTVDQFGFSHRNGSPAVFSAGVASGPKDVAGSVQEATGSVARILGATARSR